MTHPDHIIFYGALGAAQLLQPDRVRRSFRYALPFVVIFVPYYLWRWHYYGDFFPNTYYTKSADQAYYAQGAKYVLITFVSAGLFVAFPLAVLGAIRRRRNVIAQYFLISTPIFSLYVAKIGGDFMLGRLFVPLFPVLFLMAECGVRDLFVRYGRWARPIGAAAMAGLALPGIPVHVIKPMEKAWFVADERTFYPTRKHPLAPDCGYAHWARVLDEQIVKRAVSPRLAFASAGIIAYETRLPTIDTFGLTDRHIAHLRVRERSRPGHEKSASPTYLISRKVDISEDAVYPWPYVDRTSFDVDGLHFYLANFNAKRLDPLLANTHVKFTDIRKEIATYDPERVLSRESMSALECDLWFYQQYYFSNNDDPGRLAELRAKLAAANPAFVGIESFVMDTAPSGWMPVHAFHFERREQWTAEGSAFEHWPATEAVAGQSMISGNIGKFASSSTESSIDRATGRLLSEPFLIRGQVMTLRVGGGRLPNTQRVSLLVGGRPLFNATGCSSEILGQRIWNLAGLEGRAAQIEIVDSGAGDWQHILVDEIIEWQRL